jgi:hypothetical protein
LCEKLGVFIVCDYDGRIPSLGLAAWRNSCVCPGFVSLEFSGECDAEDDIPCLDVFACEGVVEDIEEGAFDGQLLVSGRKNRKKGVIRVIRVYGYLRGLCAGWLRPAPPLYQLGGVTVDTRPTCLTLSQPVSCIIDSRRYRIAYIIDCLAGIVDPLDIRPHLVRTYLGIQAPCDSSNLHQANDLVVCLVPNSLVLTPFVIHIYTLVLNSTHPKPKVNKLRWLPMVPQQWIPRPCSKRSSYQSDRSSRNTLSSPHQWTPSMAA